MEIERLNKTKGLNKIKSTISFLVVLALSAALLMPQNVFASVEDDDLVGQTTVGDYPDSYLAYEAPDLQCSQGILITSDGEVLWERDPDTQVPMASITKVMTCLVAVEMGELSDSITVSQDAEDLEGSTAELYAGDVLTLEELLYCALLPSGNDAALTIAEYYGDGDEQQFVELMNQKADELGMTNTEYSSSSGIVDEGNYTTARDCSTLAAYVMQNSLISQVVSTQEYSYTHSTTGETEVIESTNTLLEDFDGMLGIKSGFTDAAGYCFVGAAERDGITLYSVVLGSPSLSDRNSDTSSLLTWGFDHYHNVELMAAGTYVGQAVASSWLDKTFGVQTSMSAIACIFDYGNDLTVDVQMDDLSGAIEIGDYVGTISWSLDGEVICEVDLEAAESVDAPSILDWFGITWGRFINLFTGGQSSATQYVATPQIHELISAAVSDRAVSDQEE